MTRDIDIFIRQTRERSVENRISVEALKSHNVPGQIVSILRQELDSMVRVIYLLSLPIERRNYLMTLSVSGLRWKHENSKKSITDKEMVELAQKLHGWTQNVYKFGCAFIHLSSAHDYKNRDPLIDLSDEERKNIVEHLRHYHHASISDSPHYYEIVPYLPNVFEKINSNITYYIEMLEANGSLSDT